MKEWSEIMQEVDRIYHTNSTSEGRIACITDYVVREIRAAPKSVQSDDGYCSCGGEGYVMLLSGAKICNLCKRHRR